MNMAQYKDHVSRFGMKKTIQAFAYSAINKLCFFKILQGMIITTETLPRSFLEAPSNYGCSFLDNKEVLQHAQDDSTQMDSEFVENALVKGNKCYGITEKGSLESYGWYSNSATAINDEIELCFDTSWTYMYKGYTKPSSRGKRLHAIGMAKALHASAEEGSKGLISYVEAINFRSLRSTERMGYQNFGKVFVLKIFNKYFFRTEKACLPYGFTVKEIGSADGMSASEDPTAAHRN